MEARTDDRSGAARVHQSNVEGLSVRWTRRGERRLPADLPILVLHGWGAHLEAVEPILRGLEGECEVLALDLPGFGESAEPPEAWGSGEYAEFVLAFLDSQQVERCHLIGHSRGGAVAIMIASRYPQRVGRLILSDSAGLKPRRRPSYWLRVGVAKLGRVVGLFGPPGRRLQQRLRGRVASTDYLQSSEAMRATFRRVIAEDLADRLPQVAAPTLLVWGERDEDTPAWMGEEMERLIPDAGLVVFEGAGHYAYADAAARFNQTSLHFLCHQPRTVAAQAR